MDSESRSESAEEVQFSLGSLPNLIEKAAVRDLFVDHAGLIRHDTANAPCSHVFVEFCSIDSMDAFGSFGSFLPGLQAASCIQLYPVVAFLHTPESLPVQVIQEQHQDLLMQLDSRLESFGRRMEKEKSFSAMRSGSKLSRLHSQSSKLSRAFTKEDPFAALQMASSSANLPQRKLGFDPPEVDDKTALDSGGSLPVSRKESDPKSEAFLQIDFSLYFFLFCEFGALQVAVAGVL